ncbi:MAG: YezD family protein [Gammaproteobacteria bacterium]|nr:YezD family protein [Gammaproteobacteria bacterium]
MKSLNQNGGDADEIIAVLRETLGSVRFGSIEIVIHDGRVVQIDRKEKLRFQPVSEEGRLRAQGHRIK